MRRGVAQTLKSDGSAPPLEALFAGVSAAGIVLVYRYMPETKGRSLDEIEKYFEGAAARSVRGRPSRCPHATPSKRTSKANAAERRVPLENVTPPL